MAYTKTDFTNGGPPAISAEELNKIGQGIEDVSNSVRFKTGRGSVKKAFHQNFSPSSKVQLFFNVLFAHDSGDDRMIVVNQNDFGTGQMTSETSTDPMIIDGISMFTTMYYIGFHTELRDDHVYLHQVQTTNGNSKTISQKFSDGTADKAEIVVARSVDTTFIVRNDGIVKEIGTDWSAGLSSEIREFTLPVDNVRHVEHGGDNDFYVLTADGKVYQLNNSGNIMRQVQLPISYMGPVHKVLYDRDKDRLWAWTKYEDGSFGLSSIWEIEW